MSNKPFRGSFISHCLTLMKKLFENKLVLVLFVIVVTLYLSYGLRFYIDNLQYSRKIAICPSDEQLRLRRPPPFEVEAPVTKCQPQQIRQFDPLEAACMTFFWLPLIAAHSFGGEDKYLMKCPKCKKLMTLRGNDFSYDFRVKPEKKYVRSIYWCEEDDVWVNIEIPVKSE